MNENDSKTELKKTNDGIDLNKSRIDKLQKLLMDEKLEFADYREMKEKTDRELRNLQSKKEEMCLVNTNFKKYTEGSTSMVKNLGNRYSASNLEYKQQLIGSIFPEKIIFENNQVRTKRINDVVLKIISNINGLNGNKKGITTFLNVQPREVESRYDLSNYLSMQ
jgi:hypothetical protein